MKSYTFGAGVLTGIVVGAVAGMLADPIKDKDAKKMYGNNGIFRSIGSIVDNMFDK